MEYLKPLYLLFQENANKEEAVLMKKYMRDQFEFAGIKSPKRNELERQFIQKYHYPDIESLPEVINTLWKKEEREYQYFAMNFLFNMRNKAKSSQIDLYENMVVQKSWWDTVDFIAAALIGNFFIRFPEKRDDYIGKWMSSKNIWLQRSVLLFQLKFKSHTDIPLLFESIIQLKDEKEFFIRKAIGWSLRQLSKTNPEEVRKFLTTVKLAPLSVREASKYI